MGLLYYDPIVLQHDTGAHPECANRILPTVRRLDALAERLGCTRPAWQPLPLDSIALVHEPEHVQSLRHVCNSGGGRLDPDTVVSPQSYDASQW